ncbi:MAG: hypothetical protein E7589_02090 [Ruminococcaceae bacterium]|nr:hypothetical protein [Oscillospiraceae bacterium]
MEQITETEVVTENEQTEPTVESAIEETEAEEINSQPTEPQTQGIDMEKFTRSLLDAYPDADVTDERLLAYAEGRERLSPVDLYRALNFDSLVTKAASTAALEAESKLIAHIRLCGIRPAENGADRQKGGKKTPPVARLSRAERAKIAARAGRGERIEF